MNIIDELITTRQTGDSYGVDDLNRIGRTLIFIRDYLNENKYFVTLPRKVRTDWSADEVFPNAEDLDDILKNIEVLRRTASLLPDLPSTPTDMDELTAVEANNMEKILYTVYDLVRMIIAAFVYVDELYAGEV